MNVLLFLEARLRQAKPQFFSFTWLAWTWLCLSRPQCTNFVDAYVLIFCVTAHVPLTTPRTVLTSLLRCAFPCVSVRFRLLHRGVHVDATRVVVAPGNTVATCCAPRRATRSQAILVPIRQPAQFQSTCAQRHYRQIHRVRSRGRLGGGVQRVPQGGIKEKMGTENLCVVWREIGRFNCFQRGGGLIELSAPLDPHMRIKEQRDNLLYYRPRRPQSESLKRFRGGSNV